MVQISSFKSKKKSEEEASRVNFFFGLAGGYLVAMPHNPRTSGVSRQIEGEDREEARQAMNGLTIPNDFGLILRTAELGKLPKIFSGT